MNARICLQWTQARLFNGTRDRVLCWHERKNGRPTCFIFISNIFPVVSVSLFMLSHYTSRPWAPGNVCEFTPICCRHANLCFGVDKRSLSLRFFVPSQVFRGRSNMECRFIFFTFTCLFHSNSNVGVDLFWVCGSQFGFARLVRFVAETPWVVCLRQYEEDARDELFRLMGPQDLCNRTSTTAPGHKDNTIKNNNTRPRSNNSV